MAMTDMCYTEAMENTWKIKVIDSKGNTMTLTRGVGSRQVVVTYATYAQALGMCEYLSGVSRTDMRYEPWQGE